MKTTLLRTLLLQTIALCFIALTMITCAKQGTITGGPMDSIPPVFVKADPPNYTTNFDGDEIGVLTNLKLVLSSMLVEI